MREITQEEIDEKVKAHKLWLDTNEKQGRQAAFINVSITNKTFDHRNLRQAIFRYVNCVDTSFYNADLAYAFFYNIYFNRVNFDYTRLEHSIFTRCKIVDTNCYSADLHNVDFERTTLSDVDFTQSNLYKVDFSEVNIEKIRVNQTIPLEIIGQKVICTLVDTSRKNNLISYWADLGIWTTGCFQGTLEELRKAVAKTHKDNPFLRARYERAINYILEEDKADREKEQKNDR